LSAGLLFFSSLHFTALHLKYSTKRRMSLPQRLALWLLCAWAFTASQVLYVFAVDHETPLDPCASDYFAVSHYKATDTGRTLEVLPLTQHLKPADIAGSRTIDKYAFTRLVFLRKKHLIHKHWFQRTWATMAAAVKAPFVSFSAKLVVDVPHSSSITVNWNNKATSSSRVFKKMLERLLLKGLTPFSTAWSFTSGDDFTVESQRCPELKRNRHAWTAYAVVFKVPLTYRAGVNVTFSAYRNAFRQSKMLEVSAPLTHDRDVNVEKEMHYGNGLRLET
jgi:hypothetical protein